MDNLVILVNGKQKTEKDGVMNPMTVEAIAKLAGLTSDTATVRREQGESGKAGDPLTGEVAIKNGDHFLVTRNGVKGGCRWAPDIKARILRELAELSWQTLLLEGADAVIYAGLPSSLGIVEKTDVFVPVPSGYPQTMLDYAFLPADSPLKGRVPGAVQENVQFGDRVWTRISYHPHNGGGGPTWDPRTHGFHTYVDEVLTWLTRQ